MFVRSHQAEIIIIKRLIQERNNVTRVRVEPRSCDQGRRNKAPLPSLGHAGDKFCGKIYEKRLRDCIAMLCFYSSVPAHSAALSTPV